ncbi:sugar ABC transporter ATP-binding protein [Rhizobium sp. S152]|uniref:sugar ABC transporter ATP-binding protein n=1 Tax=Rhizobium sp. S152 TaxID=3055038 RepID=UPI0025A9E4A6|nr:sugar ABC transporter ATP-binding protein [Rhizobium sp. S152]MDM9625088.1 sugar ABC transporter ATP-binding protein [Rhizobium sp. S152]
MSAQQATHAGVTTGEPFLAIRLLQKRFLGTRALDDVSLDLYSGEVHALLGENGAGKSTLIKILAGVYTADEGEFLLDGVAVRPAPGVMPIAFIHQDLGLVDTMTVAENVALVAGYPRRAGMIDWDEARHASIRALSVLGVEIEPDTKVGKLSAADKAIVAIARALTLNAKIVVLDEPTAALPEKDVSRLLDTVARLRDRGVAVLYVTHRLDEVFRVANRITVLRNGRMVRTDRIGEVDAATLVHSIVGRPLQDVFVTPVAEAGRAVLSLADVVVKNVGPVSFEVRSGEVLGLVGLRGAGQTEIGRALFGDALLEAGTIRLDGREITPRSPLEASRDGIGFVSSKRREESLAGGLTVRENLYPDSRLYGKSAFSPISRKSERRSANEIIRRFSVRPADSERIIATLSGGNQQKIILARWLAAGRRVIVLEEPTLGVDVGAKAEIYGLFQNALDAGTAILLISSDMEEVAGIAHRALVFNRGRILHEVGREQLSVPRLVALAADDQSQSRKGAE